VDWENKGENYVTTFPATTSHKRITMFRWDKYFTESARDPMYATRKKSDYFKLFFPLNKVNQMINLTNTGLVKEKQVPLSIEEFWCYLGLRLQMCVIGLPRVEDYWRIQGHSIYPPHCFGEKFGMSRNRFEVIEKHFSWDEEDPVRMLTLCSNDYACNFLSCQGDKWWRIRGLLNAFNHRCQEMVDAGEDIVIDELMSLWKGVKRGTHQFGNPPAVVNMPSKPVDEGLLYRCAADALTRVILFLEVQEGKEDMELKEFQVRKPSTPKDAAYRTRERLGQVHKYHTAVTLRLARHFAGRTVYGDSAFASLATAVACAIHNLKFVGMVKTATVGYPMDYVLNWFHRQVTDNPDTCVGTHIVLETGYKIKPGAGVQADQKVVAIAYIGEGKKLKTLIATAGSTAPGNPKKTYATNLVADTSSRGRHEHVFKAECIKQTPQPAVIEDYYSYAHAIDDNNNFRQGNVLFEQHWKTKKWYTRSFTTILAICCVNAFLAYLYEHKNSPGIESYTMKEFTADIALELSPLVNTPVASAVSNSSAAPTSDHLHTFGKIRYHKSYNDRPPKTYKRRCSACGENSATYCIECSSDLLIVSLHDPKDTKYKDCLEAHRHGHKLPKFYYRKRSISEVEDEGSSHSESDEEVGENTA
jgi:hypothetical protein